MSEACGALHPETPDVVCDRRPHAMTGFHHNRLAGLVWDAAPLPSARPRGRAGLAEMAARSIRSGRTGSAADAVEGWARQEGEKGQGF
ncbi:hypothetical protein [Streptomyces sp. cg35]|uniref:hypothetical protein n=1 Tax=Streptomyces sp. cg35 TaxID=3421650 RepID=UPI003D172B40